MKDEQEIELLIRVPPPSPYTVVAAVLSAHQVGYSPRWCYDPASDRFVADGLSRAPGRTLTVDEACEEAMRALGRTG